MRASFQFFAALLVAAAAAPVLGEQPSRNDRIGLATDWSHRHVVVRHAATEEEAVKAGPEAHAKWKAEMRRDPRFAAAALRKSATMKKTMDGAYSPDQAFSFVNVGAAVDKAAPPKKGKRLPEIHRDWSTSLGTTGVGRAGVFPAKYTFDINATPSCANDFIVYPTSSASYASVTGTFTGNGGTGTVTITRGAQSITLVGNTHFTTSNNSTTEATNLAQAINLYGYLVGVRASSSGATVTVTSLFGGTGSHSVTTTEAMANFTWAAGTLSGASNPATTIVAFNNLYNTTCGAVGTLPSIMWAYDTKANAAGTNLAAVAELSPVISADGRQVAYIQRDTANVATLVVLKWSSASPGTLAAPTVLARTAPASYRACTAPCMTNIALSGNPSVTYSSPFYDYRQDVLYVGDDTGKLHKFTGVFLGTPAEYAADGFPVTVANGARLAPPVYVLDGSTDRVFVGSDMLSTTTGGKLYNVNVTPGSTATVNASIQIGATSINGDNRVPQGIRDAVLIDGSTVYVWVESIPLTIQSCGVNIECKAVFQFSTSFANGASYTTFQTLGRGQIATRQLYSGIFDNAYYNSANGTGFLYVCASNGPLASSNMPTLWRIPISAGSMGTAVQGPVLVTAISGNCSPLTQVVNGATEYLFVSVPQSLAATTYANNNCSAGTGACTIYVFNLTTLPGTNPGTWDTGTTATASLTASGGTSGIVIDNVSSTTGASQVYYSTLGTIASPVGNAIQASQAGLN